MCHVPLPGPPPITPLSNPLPSSLIPLLSLQQGRCTMSLSLSRDFLRFLDDPTFPHTVTLQVGGKQFSCSGMVLSQQSPVLEALFRAELAMFPFGGSLLVLDKVGGSNQDLIKCLEFLYGAPLELSLQNIETTVLFGSVYGVQDLFTRCRSWIKSNIDARNSFFLYRVAQKLQDNTHRNQTVQIVTKKECQCCW